jgi:hypothetical protein
MVAMKPGKIQPPVVDFSWLPPAKEWDFRAITEKECRIACHWEYARQDYRSTSPFRDGQKCHPKNYRQAAMELFPQAWITLTTEQREKVIRSFAPVPALQVRKLEEFFKRMPSSGMNPDIHEAFLKNAYVVIPSFSLHGVEAVIKAFEKWARQESKQYRRSRRAQAAELPFDTLKWLAVLRLDAARRMAGVTIGTARDTLKIYLKKNLQLDVGGVFPAYASDGAWSKASRDAKRCQDQSRNNPSLLLAELA